jgi:hypothetical protein
VDVREKNERWMKVKEERRNMERKERREISLLDCHLR